MRSNKRRLERAQKNLQRENYQEALEDYLALYNEDPADVDLLRTIADLYLQTNHMQEAIDSFRALIEQAHVEGSFSKAVFYHRKILKLAPDDADKILDLAHYLLQNNKVDEAIQEYLNAAHLLANQDKIADAIKCYEHVVELRPEETKYQELLGASAAAHKKNSIAERAFLNAAKQHLARKDAAAALVDLEQALQVDPKNADTVVRIAHLYASEDRWNDVVSLLESALLESPLLPPLLDELGSAYFHLNRLEQADQIWSRLFQVQPESYQRLVTVAQRWIETKRFANAYAQVMKLKEYCFRIHQYPVVTELLESIVDQSPNDTTVLSQLAAVHLSLNNREAYKRCLEKMFDAYSAAENYPVAAEVLDNLISVDPGDPQHPNRLEGLKRNLAATTLKSLETHLEKAAVYRRAADQKVVLPAESPRGIEPPIPIPKSTNEEIEDLLLQAELFLKYKMADQAIVPLNKLEKMQPLPAEFHSRFAELCEGVGRPLTRPPTGTDPSPSTRPVAPPRPIPKTGQAPRLIETPGGRDMEALAAIHRKVHLQQSAKAALYTTVNELGNFLKVSRCFATLSSTSKPTGMYFEYCGPLWGKSDPAALPKLLQFCESTVGLNRRPLFSDQVDDDPEFASIRLPLQTLGILSLAVWPLISQNQVIGFVGLEQGDQIRCWTGEEVLILQTVCEQLAIALAHAKLRHLVKTLAVIDDETGLISRHSFFDCLVSELERALKQASPLSVALLKLQQSIGSERQRGGLQALQFLRDFAQFVMAHTRETDIAVKFDRSIIALILPDTSQSEAEWVVQKFHSFLSTDATRRWNVMPDESTPLFEAAVAEALMTPHTEPADAATDVAFRAEQAILQHRTLPPKASYEVDQTTFRR
jgi:tetratricopeptide (TPR) repeat protein/GAF domain-containing protein